MSVSHLQDLRRALERRGWRVVDETEGDGRRIAASWRIRRNAVTAVLDSDGFDDPDVRPLSRAYGVEVRGRAAGGLYFSRVGRGRWAKDLKAFIEILEA